MKPTLCVFANFFIDNDERFQRMKDSFHSFRDVDPDEWIINIRGRLKKQAGDFLYKNIGNKICLNYLQKRCLGNLLFLLKLPRLSFLQKTRPALKRKRLFYLPD